MTNAILARRNLRNATLIVCGLGLLAIAGITQASAEASCPQWSTPVCRHWSLGPPASCTEWACAADRQSDPVTKAAALATPKPPRPPIVRPPIVRPPVATPGPVTAGSSAGTPVIFAKGFSGMGGHGHR